MSRLFEDFGEDADKVEFSDSQHAAAELLGDPEAADTQASLLTDVDVAVPLGEEPPAFEEHDGTPIALEEESFDAEPSLLLQHNYTIPDFEQDARDLTAYEDAKKRHIRQAISSAETAIHATFKQKREVLQREIKNAHSFEEERRASAIHTTRQYANAYPQHVDKKGVQPPSFFENLFSFGRAGRLFRAAFLATTALEQLRAAMKKREEALGALESQMGRAIYLKEESLKKSLESESGLAEFHARSEIKALYERTKKIERERADYAKRLDRGGVTPEEQRDRAMAEFKMTYTAVPLMGAIIAKVSRFGPLSYFQLRDLEKKESLLSYDPRLDPLRNSVFDVYSIAGAVAAKLKRNDNGTAFRVADHFKACWRNQDEAEQMYGQHRAALREERGLPKMEPRDAVEGEIIERLAALAQMVEGGPRDPMPPVGSAPNGPV